MSATLAAGDFTPGAGTLASNYNLPSSASGSGHITAVTLTASIIGNPVKTYDGNTGATLTSANFSLTPLVGSESFTVTKTTGTYNSKDVPTANSVSTTLIAVDFTAGAGTLASNYNLPATASGAGHITPAHLTVKADDKLKTYNGAVFTSFTATISGFVNSETEAGLRGSAALSGSAGFTGAATTAINANPIPYAITPTAGSLSATNYDFTIFQDGALTINKAHAVINVTGYSVTYDGNPHMATGTATGVESTPADLSSLLHLGGTTHTNAGDYPSDAWTFDGDTNYFAESGTVHDHIDKANASITVTPYTVTYDGAAHTATGSAHGVESTPADLSGLLHLGGTTHIDAGDYPADAWTFDGNGNYNAANGFVHDHITKAHAVINVTPYSVTYDGDAHTATGTASGVESSPVNLSSLLHLAGTTHTNAGDYPNDPWTFDGNSNYYSANGTVHDEIAKANATITVTPYSVTYDGNAHTATGSAHGVESTPADLSGLLHLGGTTHTDAGDYPVDPWTFDGNGNYNAASGSVHDHITKAHAVINVTPYSLTYDGDAHTATGTASGVETVPVDLSSLLHLGGTTHTNAGDYPNDPWTFAGNSNYYSASGTVHDHIDKANASILVTPYHVTYDANPHTATGTATGVKGEALAGLDLSGTTHTHAGSYTDTWTFTDATGNYNNASGTVYDKIDKANATISVTPYHVTYDGNAHTATGSAVGVLSEPLSGLDLSGTTHTHAGSYTDTWTFTDVTGNYNNASGTAYDKIDKANATISVTPYHVTYDGSAHTATGTAKGVLNESLLGLDLSATTHTNAGSYTDTWTFTDVTGNYNNASGTVYDKIDKANATISVTAYSVTYDANPHTATGTAKGVLNESLLGLDLARRPTLMPEFTRTLGRSPMSRATTTTPLARSTTRSTRRTRPSA